MQHGPKDARLCVDIYDELGIGGGASGVSGGLLHPYSPKGSHSYSFRVWKGWTFPHSYVLFFPSFLCLLRRLCFAFSWGTDIKKIFARFSSSIQAAGNWYWNFYMAFSYCKSTAKLLWRGAECWKECQKLLNIAETAEHMRTSDLVDQDLASSSDGPLIHRRCSFSSVWWLYCTIFFITFPRIIPISILRGKNSFLSKRKVPTACGTSVICNHLHLSL